MPTVLYVVLQKHTLTTPTLHLTDGEREAQRSEATCPKPVVSEWQGQNANTSPTPWPAS